MRVKTLLSLFISIILFSSIGSATVIENHRIEVDLKSDGTAHIVAKVDYGELTSVDAPYVVFGTSSNFTARDSGGALNCRPTPQTYGVHYLCRPKMDLKKNYSAIFEFDVSYLIKKQAESFTFSYLQAVSEPTKRLELALLLPEGTGIVTNNGVQPYSPDALVGSTGRRVTLDWVIKPAELGKTYVFTANYEPLGQIVKYYGNYSRVLAILFACAFVFVLIKYKFLSSKKRSISAMDVLKEDERKVMEIVLSSKDACKQNVIVRGTNFSKAKVSRIIADLEARGLIKKIHQGRTNKIVLADRGREERGSASEDARASAPIDRDTQSVKDV